MHNLLVFICLVLSPSLVTPQSLVLVGGGLSDGNAPIWNKVVELAGGRGVARIGIFATASADPQDSADYYIDMFVNVYGALSADFIPVTETSNNADDPAVVALTLNQTGFFFGGGDQIRVTNALRPGGRDTRVLRAVKDVLAAGGVVGGSSAGTACMGDGVMITGGVSYNALSNGAFAGTPPSSSDLSYEINGGLGFLRGWVPDSHFSERGREGRLIRLLQDTRSIENIGTTKGFGIDEDTALVITDLNSRPRGTVIGTTGGVFFVDVSEVISKPSAHTEYENVKTHYLTLDDSIDMTPSTGTGFIQFPSWKSSMKGNEADSNAVISNDILSSRRNRQWDISAQSFFNNQGDDTIQHSSFEKKPEFLVTFNRTTSAIGYGGFLPIPPSTFIISYINHPISISSIP